MKNILRAQNFAESKAQEIMESFPPPEHLITKAQLIRNKYKNLLFHGTGRLAYDYKNRDKKLTSKTTKDILELILKNGLIPEKDHVARVILPIEKTISLTNKRLYARYYAEEFGQNESGSNDLEYRFGNAANWKAIYMRLTQLHALHNLIHPLNLVFPPLIIKNLFTRFSIKELKK